jgi:hypothetical protein
MSISALFCVHSCYNNHMHDYISIYVSANKRKTEFNCIIAGSNDLIFNRDNGL